MHLAQVEGERVHSEVLSPKGGASGVAASLVQYVEKQGIGLVVLGARGLGGVARCVVCRVH